MTTGKGFLFRASCDHSAMIASTFQAKASLPGFTYSWQLYVICLVAW
jgi:hypothetical protein